MKYGLIILFACLLLGCMTNENTPGSSITTASDSKPDHYQLRTNIKKIEPFFKPMGEPKDYDWMASFNEPGQTFAEYLDANPTRPTSERNKIYLLPLGSFTNEQVKLL